MDFFSGDMLYYYLYYYVKIWSLNLFYSFFIVLSLCILRWVRVKFLGYFVRVLVFVEDGGVWFVFFVYGYELIIVLFIIIMIMDIVDVVYDLRQEKIYFVFGIREVFVFESDINFCW